MKTIITILFIIPLIASLGMAGQPTVEGHLSGGTGRQTSDDETVYWSQFPSETITIMGSQYFTDLYPEFDCGVADDFTFAISTTINRVRWWGGYWSGSSTPPIDSPVEMYLYLDDGSGNSPTLPQHTSAVQSWMINPGEYNEVPDGLIFMLEYDFPELVTFDPEVRYWLEIRKAFPFDPMGKYGWIQSDPVILAACVQGYDGLGIPWWTPQDADAAFELIFYSAGALQTSTWADIKTIF